MNPGQTTNQMTVVCDSSCFRKIHDFVRQQASRFGFSQTEVGRFVLAADEVCSNIIKHTYHFETHHKIVLSWQGRADSAILEIEDDSPIPYLPSPTDFDLPTKIKYRHTNGYGKYLVRKVLDDIQYETVPGHHNRVLLVKRKDGTDKKESIANPYDRARARSLTLLMLFELGETLGRQQTLDGLMKVFLYAVMGRLMTQPIALLAPISSGAPFGLLGHVGLSKKVETTELALSRHGWVVETLWAQRGPFLVSEFKKLRIPKEELELLDQLHAAVMIPIFIFGQLRGILSLGPKRTRQAFSEEDVHLVTFLGSHVLLMAENLERGTAATGGFPAKPGGDLRAAARAAMARLATAVEEANIAVDFHDEKGIPLLAIDAEKLQKVVYTLLTHILYLTNEQGIISLELSEDGSKGSLITRYPGRPLGLEKGKPGYNPLIDQMLAGTLRLTECRKVVQAAGGDITVREEKGSIAVTLTAPLKSSLL